MSRIDYEKMKRRCLAPIEDFYSEGVVTTTPDGVYIHKDNGSNILAIAHLDTVITDPLHFYVNRIAEHGASYDIVMTPTLDDRLGAYIILDLLPALGLNFDILLTEGEEQARSTAAHFKTDKQYNWMFQFDRMGTDVATYQYGGSELDTKLTSVGFKTAHGSFTDICKMSHLMCKGFNVACAYYNNHSSFAYAHIWEMIPQVQKFITFYTQYKDTYLPHDPASEYKAVHYGNNRWYNGQAEWDNYDNYSSTSYKKKGKKLLKSGSKKTSDEGWEDWEKHLADQYGAENVSKETELLCAYCDTNSKSKSEDRCIEDHEMCINCFFDLYGVEYSGQSPDDMDSYAEAYGLVKIPSVICPMCGETVHEDEAHYTEKYQMCFTCLSSHMNHDKTM